jgi:4-amino-4-deoxy-L-arabinose transferase-like glycosyltransferase
MLLISKYTRVLKYYWGLFLSFLIILYFLIPKVNEPFIMDETSFPEAAKGVSEKGFPDFYNGESRSNDLAIWHPPLYVYSLGLWIRLLGDSNYSIRGFGWLCTFATGFVIYHIVRELKNPSNSRASENFSALFYISHYSILQLAQVNDIDGTVLPLFITLALLFFIRVSQANNLSHLVATFSVGLALGLAISSKFTTSLLLIPLLCFVFYQRGLRAWRLIANSLLATIIGVLFFLSWWVPIAIYFKMDWFFPVKFTLQSFTSKNQSDSIFSLITGFITFPPSVTLWLGIPTLLLSVLSLLLLVIERRNLNKWEVVILLFGFTSWGVFNSIGAVGFTFPRYWNIGIIALSIFIGVKYSQMANYLRLDTTFFQWKFLFAVTFMYFSYSIFLSEKAINDLGVMSDLLNQKFLVVYSLIVLLTAGTTLAKKFVFSAKNAVCALITLTMILGIANNFAVNLSLKKAEFNTRYFFGEKGLKETSEWLSRNVRSDDVVISAKDVGLNGGVRFYEDAILYYTFTPESLKEFVEQNSIDYIVVRKKYDYSRLVFEDMINAITQDFSLVSGDFYDFEIWRKVIS